MLARNLDNAKRLINSPYAPGVPFGLSQSPGIEVVKKGAVFLQYCPLFDNSIEGAFASVQMALPVRKVSN